jgi:hypothetical protein
MSIGVTHLDNESKIEVALKNTLKSLNRPDILIEESKDLTKSFQNYVRKRKESGIDPSVDLFDPLSQSNSNIQKIDDLYDIVIPSDNEDEETANARNKYRRNYPG